MQYSIDLAESISFRRVVKDPVKERHSLLKTIRNALLNPYLDESLKPIFEDRLAELNCTIFAR